jgi:hypothetical protein
MMMNVSPFIVQQDDTTSVCVRNSITDITFYDSNNFVSKIEFANYQRFPFIFIEKNKQLQNDTRIALIKHLKPGKDIAVQQIHSDWIILIIMVAVILFSLIRTESKNLLTDATRFFLFRGINDSSSRDVGGIFHWQSTILNLVSFFIIGLFAYCSSAYFNIIPTGISGIFFWLISLGIIVVAVTLRHIVSIIAGNASGEIDAFREYLFGVYLFYRFSALFLFIIVVLMSFTVFFPERGSIISGFIVLGILYLIRAVRLMIIFMNRNISLFYLILYLCALEILPVLISIKYFSGLV